MKKTISVIAILGLSACMGGDGSDGGGSIPAPGAPEPDPVVTSDITLQMDGARSRSLSPVFYNAAVGRITQDHAQDMVDRNYLSIFDQGTTTCAGAGGLCDMGDDLNDVNRNWDQIVQMVAQGDKTVPVLFAEFRNRTLANNVGQGDLNDKLNDALNFDEQYEFFGLGKAGTGSDTKWAFIFVDPRDTWTNR